MNRSFKNIFLVLILMILGVSSGNAQKASKVIDVIKYGAKGDGKTLDTKAIQEAIDAAAKLGNGSKVLVPKDHQYLISTLVFRRNCPTFGEHKQRRLFRGRFLDSQ
jgi:hypothetical protein